MGVVAWQRYATGGVGQSAGMSNQSNERSSWASPRVIAAGVLALLVLIFVIENTRKVQIRFLIPEVKSPVWVALLITFAVGVLAGMLFAHRRDR